MDQLRAHLSQLAVQMEALPAFFEAIVWCLRQALRERWGTPSSLGYPVGDGVSDFSQRHCDSLCLQRG